MLSIFFRRNVTITSLTLSRVSCLQLIQAVLSSYLHKPIFTDLSEHTLECEPTENHADKYLQERYHYTGKQYTTRHHVQKGAVSRQIHTKRHDTLVIKQEAELFEAFTNFETQNKYRAYDKIGRHLLYIAEESGCLVRQFCSSGRNFSLHVYDNNMNEVLTLQSPKRPFMGPCCYACCDFCSHQIHVFCCAQEIGYIQEICNFKYTFVVYTAEGEPVYQIEAPYCRWDSCCCDDVFHIYRYDGDVSVAQIRKTFAGFGKEIFTDADTFGISFPKEMHVHDKALLFAATFMIDFMFYEDNTQKDKAGKAGPI